MSSSDDLTVLLRRVPGGGADAFDAVLPVVYDELRRLAAAQMRRSHGHTMPATALVHEAYERLVDQTRADYADRSHFFGVAAKAMRHILIDHARRRTAAKRGGQAQALSLDDVPTLAGTDDRSAALLDLDEALTQLAKLDARMAKIVELRFFGGLDEASIGEVVGCSERTVRREWRKARLFLADAMA